MSLEYNHINIFGLNRSGNESRIQPHQDILEIDVHKARFNEIFQCFDD